MKIYRFIIQIYKGLLTNPNSFTKIITGLMPFIKSDYLFVVQEFHSASYRYRVLHLIELLKLQGYKSEITHINYPLIKQKIKHTKNVIFFRLDDTLKLANLYSFCKKRKKTIIYSVDDLIFHKYGKKAFQRADKIIVSTAYLKQMIEDKRNVIVIPNLLSKHQLKIYTKYKKKKSNYINMAYLSGSKTHDKDFESISEPICQIMKKYKNTKLYIYGYLTIPKKLNKFGERIIKKNFVNWRKLPKITSFIDINLVPLEIGNDFCESKSEIKYLEASLSKIPSIVSGMQVYKKIIINNKTGFIAYTTNDWLTYLDKLIADKDIRIYIGKNSNDFVQYNYSVESYFYKNRKVNI